jgi:hypothetical protein
MLVWHIAVMPVIGMVATSTFLRSFRQEMFEDDPPTQCLGVEKL